MTKNIFFDLDGTLIDCKPRLYNLFCELVPESKFTFDEYIKIKAARVDQYTLLRKYFNYTDMQIKDFKFKWLSEIETVSRLKADTVFEFVDLAGLATCYNLYIVTNRQYKDRAIQQLLDLSLLKYFKSVLVTEQKKSKTELILESVPDFSSNDVIVGDTGEDIQTGKELGIKTIAVESGVLSAEILAEYNPDKIVRNIGDLDEDYSL